MDRLTAMQVLVRVVETGSSSGAARQLCIGQPAVSKTIAQLEERLGVSLLLRSSRGLSPTEAELAARGAGAGLAGRLRFSSGVTFGRLVWGFPCQGAFPPLAGQSIRCLFFGFC